MQVPRGQLSAVTMGLRTEKRTSLSDEAAPIALLTTVKEKGISTTKPALEYRIVSSFRFLLPRSCENGQLSESNHLF